MAVSPSAQLIRLAAILESLAERVLELTSELKQCKTELQQVKETTLAMLRADQAVHDEKIKRLESITYAVLAALGAETLTIIGAFIVWAITRVK